MARFVDRPGNCGRAALGVRGHRLNLVTRKKEESQTAQYEDASQAGEAASAQ